MTERRFPILKNYRTIGAIAETRVKSIPWSVIAPHEKQALSNHSQSLEMLASRQGLSWSEILAVLEDRAWTRVGDGASMSQVMAIVERATAPVEAAA